MINSKQLNKYIKQAIGTLDELRKKQRTKRDKTSFIFDPSAPTNAKQLLIIFNWLFLSWKRTNLRCSISGPKLSANLQWTLLHSYRETLQHFSSDDLTDICCGIKHISSKASVTNQLCQTDAIQIQFGILINHKYLIDLIMFQKEALPISFGEKYQYIICAFRALNDTLVFLVEQQTEEGGSDNQQTKIVLLHTDSHGKVLLRKEMKSNDLQYIEVDMISPKQVVVYDNADKKIWLIDLEMHNEWSTTVDTQNQWGYTTYFKQTKLLCWMGGWKGHYRQLVYYDVKDLRENNAKPTIKQEIQFEGYNDPYVCNNHSKFWFHQDNEEQTFEFLYFDLNNDGKLRTVRANKGINTLNYFIISFWEVQPNVYLVIYLKKSQDDKFIKEPLFKYSIINATKDQQSASIHQLSLPFNNDPKTIEMQQKYNFSFSCFIDLGEVWVFRLKYKNTIYEIESILLHYVRRETLELIHTEELTHFKTDLQNNHSAPQFPPFYHVEIQKQTQSFKDFILHFTTLIVPFTLREVSMCFLLHLNEDFDDDLLMDAVDLIAE